MARTLFLRVPNLMEGEDVDTFQYLAANNKYGDFFDGVRDKVFGIVTRDSAIEARKALGYPDSGANDWHNGVVGPRLIQFLNGSLPLPAAYKKRREQRLRAKPKLVKPLPTPMGAGSEFTYEDAEGAPGNDGKRHHAGKDWFAPGNTRLISPVDGLVKEARHSSDTSGQVFGGAIKILAHDPHPTYRKRLTHVFRHVFPLDAIEVGMVVKAAQKVGKVTRWSDWPEGSHAHCEIWLDYNAGYDYENMLDPVLIYKDAV